MIGVGGCRPAANFVNSQNSTIHIIGIFYNIVLMNYCQIKNVFLFLSLHLRLFLNIGYEVYYLINKLE